MINSSQGGKEEKISQDHQCSICLSVFYKPLRLVKCKHLFCQNCLNEAALIVQNRRCPLCRTDFHQHQVIQEPQFWNELQKRYPNAISQKKKIIKERIFGRFLVGNITQFLQTQEENRYKWTLFVRPAPGDKRLSETIKKIDVRLHPTFSPSTISYAITGDKTVQLSRIGWGTFRIGIIIHWKDIYQERVSEIFHDLQFQPIVQQLVHTSLTLK